VQLAPARGSEIQKTRPCVVLTSDIVNAHRRTVVIVPLSTLPNSSPPLLVEVSSSGRRAVAVLDQIRAVSKERLLEKIGTVAGAEIAALEEGLREILEL